VDRSRAWIWKAAAVIGAVIVLPLATMTFPFIYNHHLAPLARLHKRVHAGDDCASTARAFAAFYQARRAEGNDDVQLSDGFTDDTHAFDHLHPRRRLLHLYDLAFMDDVQLTAICDASGARVERVLYLGD
jgi:hypothetical protein